ncbi:cDNA sequence BC048562 [Cricetulus griseus]
MRDALIGSWYNSGFYGHYRGQVKSESAGEYRLAAKPPPPAVFLQRCEEPVRQHFFSKHDNRTSFDKAREARHNSSVTILGLDGAQANPGCQDCGPRARTVEEGPYWLLQGIGRRKDLERLWKRHTFLRWAPCELELSQQPPLESSYQTDFGSGSGLSRLPQRLVHFMQIQPPYVSTTYQHNFCHPSRGGHCGSAKVRPQEPATEIRPDRPGIPRPKLLQHYLHDGVSECLNWSQALNRLC